MLFAIVDALEPELPGILSRVIWGLTPNQRITVSIPDPSSDSPERQARMTDEMTTRLVQISERFEFAAAHRLAVPDKTDEENFAIFGKCANPNHHGHNYILEVCASVPCDQCATNTLSAKLGERVEATAIELLDHKNLSTEVEAFNTARGGVIPSVENIARFCFETLEDEVRDLGASLARVTVWETERTSATYPA